jgi:hypothetical protein
MEAHEALRRHEEVVTHGTGGHNGGDGLPNGLAQQAAVVVAVIAAFLAVATFLSNEAVKKVITEETQAADTTASLEANATRTTVAQGNVTLLKVIGEGSAKQSRAAAEAEKLDEHVTEHYAPIDRELNREIAANLHQRDHADTQHLFYELAEVALQIGIVLAGISILARRRWLLGGGVGVAVAGVVLLMIGVVA